MYNKKALSKATAELDKAKAPKKPKDIITDPKGQWKYPGEVTRIPSNDITMKGVGYPVVGVANTGQRKIMLPGADYTFPGADYVDEYPQMKKGGQHNGDIFRQLPHKNVYMGESKSLSATNRLFTKNKHLMTYEHKLFNPKAKHFQEGGEYIELELTPDEIEEYRKGGFIVEDISVPELNQAKKGKIVNTSKSPKPSVYTAKNEKDYAFRKKAYDDSLSMYNLSKLADLAYTKAENPNISENEMAKFSSKGSAYIEKMKKIKANSPAKFGYVFDDQRRPTQTIVKPYKPEADETNKKSNTNKTKETILEISDPKEFAYRDKMYNDSLDLYNYSNKQIADKTKRFGSDAVGVKKEYNKKKAAEFLKEQLKTYGDLAHDPKDKYGKLITKLVKKSNISPIGLSINVEDYDYIFKKPTQKVVLKTENKPVQDTIIQKPVVQQEVKHVIQQNVKPVQKTGYPQGYQPYSLYGKVLDPEVYGYAESLNGKPVQVAQFADTYGYKAKMDAYKKSGQYPWKKQKGGMVAQLTPKEIQEYINQGYIVEEH